MEGLETSKYNTIVVMDGDLHATDYIPKMIDMIRKEL